MSDSSRSRRPRTHNQAVQAVLNITIFPNFDFPVWTTDKKHGPQLQEDAQKIVQNAKYLQLVQIVKIAAECLKRIKSEHLDSQYANGVGFASEQCKQNFEKYLQGISAKRRYIAMYCGKILPAKQGSPRYKMQFEYRGENMSFDADPTLCNSVQTAYQKKWDTVHTTTMNV